MAFEDIYSVASGGSIYGGMTAPGGGSGEIPAWVPPSGYFADIPMTNMATDIRPSIYSNNQAEGVFNRWTGGCILRDYSALGAWAVIGAGHDPFQPDIRFTPIADFSTLTWYCANALTSYEGHYPDYPEQVDSSTGLFIIDTPPNTMPLNPHTYLGVQEVPAAWGGGPKGSVMQFAYAGSNFINRINVFDVSKATYGHKQLQTVQAQNVDPTKIRLGPTDDSAAYPITAIDRVRQGWWLEATGTHAYTLFCDKNGTITQYPTIHGNVSWGCMTHVKSDTMDLLVMINGGSTTTLRVRDLATGTTATVPLTGGPLCYNAGGNESRPEIGGFLWVEELGVIAGIDCMNLPMKFMTITPPATNPLVNAWTIAEVPLQHWDAGDPSGSSTIRFAGNGNYSKFQWVPSLQAFVLATSANTKPQVFKI